MRMAAWQEAERLELASAGPARTAACLLTPCAAMPCAERLCAKAGIKCRFGYSVMDEMGRFSIVLKKDAAPH